MFENSLFVFGCCLILMFKQKLFDLFDCLAEGFEHRMCEFLCMRGIISNSTVRWDIWKMWLPPCISYDRKNGCYASHAWKSAFMTAFHSLHLVWLVWLKLSEMFKYCLKSRLLVFVSALVSRDSILTVKSLIMIMIKFGNLIAINHD